MANNDLLLLLATVALGPATYPGPIILIFEAVIIYLLIPGMAWFESFIFSENCDFTYY